MDHEGRRSAGRRGLWPWSWLLGVLSAVAGACVVGGCAGIEKRPGLLDAVFAPVSSDWTVVTFNIRYGTAPDGDNAWPNRRELVLETIRTLDPDVLCVQEALRDQLDDIRRALPEFGEAGAGRDDGKQAGEYAAILYRRDRLRLDSEKTFWLSPTPDQPGSRGWGASLPRVCTTALLVERRSGAMLQVFNTHLDHQSAAARAHGAELIGRAIHLSRMVGVPVVLAGDLNEGEAGPVVSYLTGRSERATEGGGRAEASPRLADTFRTVKPDESPAGTYHAFKGDGSGPKIDFVLADRSVPVLDAGIDRRDWQGRYASDHFAVWARLRIARP
ncbi:MAG: endonuclease/exonuclease/phosphatase family protein [Phycisphaerae bacterium]|nr:endonuclease/exonuclease/phosphatase family protein [Phycisphaerae bacterium]